MASSDLFKPRPAPPTDLREALIDAVARQDGEGLAGLCERHQDEIRHSFPGWRQVPEAVRQDREAQAKYAGGLIAVAQVFEQGGDGSLIAMLMGSAAENPLEAWERALATARSLIEQGQPQEAAELLQSTLDRSRELQGSGVTSYLARTHGMRGAALFRAGDKGAAIEATRRARELCAEAGDDEGVAIYSGNLQRMEEGARAADGDTEGLDAPGKGRAVTAGQS